MKIRLPVKNGVHVVPFKKGYKMFQHYIDLYDDFGFFALARLAASTASEDYYVIYYGKKHKMGGFAVFKSANDEINSVFVPWIGVATKRLELCPFNFVDLVFHYLVVERDPVYNRVYGHTLNTRAAKVYSFTARHFKFDYTYEPKTGNITSTRETFLNRSN